MTAYSQVLEKIVDELRAFTKGRTDIGQDTDLLADLNLDSLQVMNLLLQIEDHFDISIPVNILSDVRTVKDLAMQIERLTARH
jgi:acyl carrier protein